MRDDRLPVNDAAETLAGLRAEIDRLDLEMHELLMRRGEIIGRLIEVKRRQGPVSAFRPDREAQMMRALVARHKGLLPLDTVEGVWRIIISTFTYAQANYRVHADDSGHDAIMRDSARFHFGFTVPYVPHPGARAVIDAVAASRGDLGVVRAAGTEGAWWARLRHAEAPKIIARLPFVERPDHPAGLPVFVIARPLAEAAAQDVSLFAILLERRPPTLQAAIKALGGEVVGEAAEAEGVSLLVSAPGGMDGDNLARELEGAGAGAVEVARVGSHAARFELDGARGGF